MNMLAFDLGASSGKLFQGNYDGHSLALKQLSRFNNRAATVRGEMFWDVLEIFDHLRDGISQAFRGGDTFSSIGLDSFSNDFGLLDQDGRFVTQVHAYRDSRTKRNEDQIYSLISRRRLHQLCGNQNALFGTLMQLASMSLEKQGYLLQGAGSLLLIPDLFNYFLTGEIHSEYTISSVSQMLDFGTGTWSPEILQTFGIPGRILPDVIRPGSVVGGISQGAGCSHAALGCKVIAVCEHDTASAFLAAPFGEGSIIISSGTWSLVGVEADAPFINDFTFEHNIANEGGYPGHHRLLKNVMGQWLVQECQRAYMESGQPYSISEMMDLAARERHFRFMINPDDERFFSPGDMPEKIAAYCSETGQGRPQGPGQVLACVLESLAMKYRLVMEELEVVTGHRFKEIIIVGGGSNNGLLNQYVANVTDRRVLAGPQEATSLGNLLVQLIAAGEIGSVEQGRQLIMASFPVQAFEPGQRSDWEARYEAYIQMIKAEA
jgi:sugar (pentulose or hexulose) kinase